MDGNRQDKARAVPGSLIHFRAKDLGLKPFQVDSQGPLGEDAKAKSGWNMILEIRCQPPKP